jgi:hypothetical protein
MVVASIDEQDVDRRTREPFGRPKAAKASTYDHDTGGHSAHYNKRAMRRHLAVLLAAVAVLLTSPRASAFGAVGHHVVARIAWALMSATAQDRAAALLDGRQDVFVASSTWADEVRSAKPETYNWHFVDIPVGITTYDAARDCPATGGDCVIAAIARLRASHRRHQAAAAPTSH